jgi:hypothetical protein
MASAVSPTQLQVRPRWWAGDLRPTWRSVAVCALLPALAFVAGQIVGVRLGEAVAVAVLAAAGLTRWLRLPVLRVTGDAVELFAGSGQRERLGVPAGAVPSGAPVGAVPSGAHAATGPDGASGHGAAWVSRRGSGAGRQAAPTVRLPTDRLVDAVLCRRGEAAEHAATTANGGEVYLALRHPHADPDAIDALLVTVRNEGGDERVLLPIWRPGRARPLLRAVGRATGRLDDETVARAWPDPGSRWTASLRAALRAERGRLTGACLLAGAVVVTLWQLLRLVRAATLDALLGTFLGELLRLASALVLTAGAAGAVAALLVACLTLLVWRRAGRPVTLTDALELGRLRATWLLWQVRIWLGGVALLATVTGVGTARYAVGYALASGAIPVLQAVTQVARRGVEEVHTHAMPPLERVARAHQWIAGVAAVVLYLFWMLL